MKVGRYTLLTEFASGGMASIHFGRLSGAAGFSRVVAIKCMHKQFARDAEFVKMFVDEARVTASVQHPNVVSVLDVVREDGQLFLVMDYVHGESLSKLIKLTRARGGKVPPPIATRMVSEMLAGLHAAHEARDPSGNPLEIVHRDVSPQNLLVGMDGVSRVVDFGVAKASGRLQATAEGNLKGKLGYFSPEQLRQDVDRRTDVFAAAIVLWEALIGKRLFVGDTQWDIVQEVVHKEIPPPSTLDEAVPEALSAAVMRGLERDKEARYATAREFAQALEKALPLASTTEVGGWVQAVAGAELDARRAILAASEDMAELLPPPSTAFGSTPNRREAATGDAPGADDPEVTRAESAPRKRDVAAAPAGRAEEPAPSVTSPSLELTRARTSTVTPPGSSRLVAVLGLMVGVAGIAFAVGRGRAPERQDASAPSPPSPDTATATATVEITASSSRLDAAPSPPSDKSTTPSAEKSAARFVRPATSGAPALPSVSEEPAVGKRCFHVGAPFAGLWCSDPAFTGGVGCVDLNNDSNHCGGCNRPCKGGTQCIGGVCGTRTCGLGETLCPSGCVSLNSNPSNCGQCDLRCAKRCVRGRCDD